MSSVNLGQMGDDGAAQGATMQFIQQFYALLDGESPEAAQEWSDMFADDAEFVTPVQTLGGRQGIHGPVLQQASLSRSYSLI
jgi:hypothetical protein